ncbi:MAG: phage Gp37/Gp68 family protein [Candidatus Promineifilaceae bacterium]
MPSNNLNMAENSKIEWCDHTFNPWIGCTKVSDGCKNCYAERLMDKWYGRVEWGPRGKRIRTNESYWRQPLKWNEQLHKDVRRLRIFCGSLCDVFEYKGGQPELYDWRCDLFNLINLTPNLNWLLLTKRPSLASFLEGDWHNIWLGTSIEDQASVDKRLPYLLRRSADVHFLSCEPLLGPIDLSNYVFSIDWVIVGGESGPSARPMDLDWARSIRDQCQAAAVPFFMKQVDKKQPIPKDLTIREWPVIKVRAECSTMNFVDTSL